MTAGALRACGVFFGDTEDPNEGNPHGNLEHPRWKARPTMSRDAWFRTLRSDGWQVPDPWGIKAGVRHRNTILTYDPSLIVLCKRPMSQIADSRKRCGFGDSGAARKQWDRCLRLAQTCKLPVVTVDTAKLASGDYSQVEPACYVLGIPFNPDRIAEWIDPEAFHV